jgi:hypothetical protein
VIIERLYSFLHLIFSGWLFLTIRITYVEVLSSCRGYQRTSLSKSDSVWVLYCSYYETGITEVKKPSLLLTVFMMSGILDVSSSLQVIRNKSGVELGGGRAVMVESEID